MAFSKIKSEETEEMNLIPVMNLMMVLIPFLLMGAAFFQIGVIPVSTPTHSPSDSDVPKTPTTVACNLVISEDALELTVSSTSLTEEELEELGEKWPKKGGEYDVEGLQKKLIELKTAYPESTTIIVLPYEELPYDELINVLDYLREQTVGKDENNEPIKKELFPVTVFSRFIPAPPGSEGGGEEGGGEEGGGEEGGEE